MSEHDPAVITWTLAVNHWHARQPRPGQRPHWWRHLVTDAWRSAMEAWEREAEAVALGYDTELAEFRQVKPPPRLRDFMIHLSSGRIAP